MVVLVMPQGSGLVNWDLKRSWESLADEQLRGEMGDLSFKNLEEDDVLAMLDRNCYNDKDWRKVFVWVESTNNIMLFDEHGAIIDDPANFVPGGRQKMFDEEKGFENDWVKEGYYRLPQRTDGVETGEGGEGGRDVAKAKEDVADRTERKEDTPMHVFSEGNRVLVRFNAGSHAELEWHGALVSAAAQGDSSGTLYLGFDDGDLKCYTQEGLQQLHRDMVLRYEPDFDPYNGVVASHDGLAAAAGFTRHHGQPAGVLVGCLSDTMGGAAMYAEHYVCAERFKRDGKRTRQQPQKSTQDREGFHTFRCGDYVVYTNCAPESEEEVTASIFAIGHCKGTKQERKFLVLYDDDEFFLSSMSHWRRISTNGIGDAADPDGQAFTPSSLPTAKRNAMLDGWEEGSKLAHVKKESDIANALKQPPPLVKVLRRNAAKREKDEEKVRAHHSHASVLHVSLLTKPSLNLFTLLAG